MVQPTNPSSNLLCTYQTKVSSPVQRRRLPTDVRKLAGFNPKNIVETSKLEETQKSSAKVSDGRNLNFIGDLNKKLAAGPMTPAGVIAKRIGKFAEVVIPITKVEPLSFYNLPTVNIVSG